MSYILEVSKNPYRDGDHLAFIIYKEDIKDIGGVKTNYEIITHYEKLGPLERNKEGGSVNLYEFSENQYKVYYSFQQNLSEEILSWANSVKRMENNYEKQLKEFITLIVKSGEFNRL